MNRESLEFDVLFVGAGPASLAGAYHLAQMIRRHNEGVASGSVSGRRLDEISIAVIEKGKTVSSHALSGGILDPRALRELMPDFMQRGAPLDAPVTKDHIYLLTRSGKLAFPVIPPPLNNHGNYIISLGRLVGWLAEQCEQLDVNIFPEFPGADLIYQGERVSGVRAADKGLDKSGKPKANFEPGPDLLAKVTVLGEGPRGTLAKKLIQRFGFDPESNPQVYSVGVKEIWQLPENRLPAGTVIHTMGYPLGNRIFGGGFIYAPAGDVLYVGLVVGLDYQDPATDPHQLFGRWKKHPLPAGLLRGARLLEYGAKAIPEGGLFSQPRMAYDGVLVIGDSAGFLNSQRLKGIHLGMKSGMLAAETIFDCLVAGDFSRERLEIYPQRYRQSWAHRELYRVRNFHQGFDGGLLAGMFHAGLQMLSGGRGLHQRYPTRAGHERMQKYQTVEPGSPAPPHTHSPAPPHPRSPAHSLPPAAKEPPDNTLTFDKVTDVYHSGAAHDENQPCHLHVLDLNICHHRCRYEYGNPCQHFCPAGVYEILARERGEVQLQINFSNCVHCKTCDIMDPYQIIDWGPPQGGDGPNYKKM
ncbi:MAG TPA: electron transfer flavoprotein-ubiquinone oxidoreductase [Acidobacteriota bacterium]